MIRLLAIAFASSSLIWAASAQRSSQLQLASFFEENRGQFGSQVRFSARTLDGVLLLEDQGHTIAAGSSVVRYRLVGAREESTIEGLEALTARGHYYLGNDSSRWRTGVPLYQRVEYREIYAGIRMIHYRSADGRLEHDFVVAPGGDPEQIRFRIDADSLALSADGDLVAGAASGPIVYRKPVAYRKPMRGGGRSRRTIA
jgi:hypothetical protein